MIQTRNRKFGMNEWGILNAHYSAATMNFSVAVCPETIASCEWIKPLDDPRWPKLTARHPRASIFHTAGWLEALRRTYGYEPTALAICRADGELASAIVFCGIKSPWTGRRLVSLPFSDHCDLLAEDDDEQERLLDAVCLEQKHGRWKYVEWRPTHGAVKAWPGPAPDDRYLLHRLDLRPSPSELLRAFHHNHVLRKIRRSERERLTYQEGRSERLLNVFYRLFVQTRRRHGLPPQPYRWFRNILDCLPEQATVRVAFKNATPIAAIMTLRSRETMVYKYGASDVNFHALGGMHLLLWRTILDARERGCVVLDFGRSEAANKGLVAFKDHWGASRSTLSYWTQPASQPGRVKRSGIAAVQRILTVAPDWLLITAGRVLYRHNG